MSLPEAAGRTTQRILELAGIDGVFAVVGISPDFSSTDSAFIGKLVKLIKGNKKIVGIGEIGLDSKVIASNPFEIQMKVFSEQVRIAKDIGLPIVIHSRGYLDEVVKVLEQERVRGAMFHFFDGDEIQAVELAKKGHFISISSGGHGKEEEDHQGGRDRQPCCRNGLARCGEDARGCHRSLRNDRESEGHNA